MEYQPLSVSRRMDGRVHLEDFSNPAWSRLVRKHAHAFFEMHLLVRGTAVMLVGDARIDLPAGSLLWIPPRTEHLTLETSDGLRRWIVSLRGTAVRRTLDKGEMTDLVSKSRGIACVQLSRRELLSLDRILVEVEESQGQVESLTNAGLNYIIARGARASRESVRTTESTTLHPVVARALDLMRGDGLSLSREELAERCGLSATHMSRLFVSELGQSLRDVRNRRRLARYQQLIDARSCASITDAAFEAGFGSYSQFHRVHRKMLGRSPSDGAG